MSTPFSASGALRRAPRRAPAGRGAGRLRPLREGAVPAARGRGHEGPRHAAGALPGRDGQALRHRRAARAAIDDGALDVRIPKHAKKELDAFLDCGLLCRGFARLCCPRCNEGRPVACERLLRALDLEVEAARDAGETTAVIVAVSDAGRVAGASSGDSGALVVRADGTTDDLTATQRRKRRVGSGAAAPVGFERARLEGTLVVASDGLLAYARPPVVAEVVLAEGDLEDAARALVDRVRLPRGALVDDVAIVLARGDPAR